MWTCPKCGEKMHDVDDQCWSCKTRNPAMPERPPAAGTAAPAASAFGKTIMNEPTKKCPYCAEEILAAAVKCKFCGSALPDASAGTGDGYVRMPRVVAVLAAFFILAAVVTWAWGLVTYFGLWKGWGAAGAKPAAAGRDTADAAKKGAYEEIVEYDARGNITKSTKNYE